MRLAVEAARSAAAQPVATTVTALIVAGVCSVILSTTGQTVQVEQQVLSQIDAAGTRSIVITDVGGAGINDDAVDRISRLSGIEWVIGLGPATDVRAAGIPGGNPAAIRSFHGELPPQIRMEQRAPMIGEAVVGSEAQEVLGLRTPFGGVVGEDDLAVVGGFEAADPLVFLNRSLITAPEPDETNLRSIHILAARPSDVAGVAEAALLLLGAEDPTSISVETSEVLADVRAAVAGELGRFSRALVALTLGSGLVLTALAVYGAVTSRRKDFGRRRALGASRFAVIGLVALQSVAAAAVGAFVGSIVTAAVLARTTGQPPDARFAVAVALLAVLTTAIAALPPAVVAAYRDPIRVLRVP